MALRENMQLAGLWLSYIEYVEPGGVSNAILYLGHTDSEG